MALAGSNPAVEDRVLANISAAGLKGEVLTPLNLVGGPAGGYVAGTVRVWGPSGWHIGDFGAAAFYDSSAYAFTIARQDPYYGKTNVAGSQIVATSGQPVVVQPPVFTAPTTPVQQQSPSQVQTVQGSAPGATSGSPQTTGTTQTTAPGAQPGGTTAPPPSNTGAASGAPEPGAVASTQPIYKMTGNVLLDDIQARAAADAFFKGGRGGYWHWNYYFEQVTGQSGPSPEEIGLSGDENLSFAEYWERMSNWSGLPASLKGASVPRDLTTVTQPAQQGGGIGSMIRALLGLLLAGIKPASW